MRMPELTLGYSKTRNSKENIHQLTIMRLSQDELIIAQDLHFFYYNYTHGGPAQGRGGGRP
jgi:hypothetical protein